MVRGACIDKNGMKKGAWSKDEDNKLRAYIQRYGHWNWRQLPKFAGLSRCGKSCRLRWVNYLRPNIKLGNYTKEEEDVILKLHGDLGNKWSAIAAELPGRSDNEIKNYWHTYLKKCGKENQNVLGKKSEEISQSEEKYMETSSLKLKNIERESPSSTEVSSLSHSLDCAVSSGLNWVGGDSSVVSSEPLDYEPTVSNFWTEPFMADNDTMASVNHFLSPSSLMINMDEELLWSTMELYFEHTDSMNC